MAGSRRFPAAPGGSRQLLATPGRTTSLLKLLLGPSIETPRANHLCDSGFGAFAWTFYKNTANRPTLRLRFWSFCLDLPQKHNEPSNFTISVLELSLKPSAKKQRNRKADFNFTISFSKVSLKPSAKKQRNRKVGHSA